MTDGSNEFAIDSRRWLKAQIRLTALEHRGDRLSYRFDFPLDVFVGLTCWVYFTDDDSNSMESVSEEERGEIYEGWIALGMRIIQTAVQLAEMPPSFQWKPMVTFKLLESYGMGSALVYEGARPFIWPVAED